MKKTARAARKNDFLFGGDDLVNEDLKRYFQANLNSEYFFKREDVFQNLLDTSLARKDSAALKFFESLEYFQPPKPDTPARDTSVFASFLDEATHLRHQAQQLRCLGLVTEHECAEFEAYAGRLEEMVREKRRAVFSADR